MECRTITFPACAVIWLWCFPLLLSDVHASPRQCDQWSGVRREAAFRAGRGGRRRQLLREHGASRGLSEQSGHSRQRAAHVWGVHQRRQQQRPGNTICTIFRQGWKEKKQMLSWGGRGVQNGSILKSVLEWVNVFGSFTLTIFHLCKVVSITKYRKIFYQPFETHKNINSS